MTVQLITPNPNITCKPGMCLEYVRETFGLGPKYPSATAGWNASERRHTDQKFPKEAWVPVWFSLRDDPNGHVALRQPDGSIWSSSSPTSTMPIRHASLNDIQSYYDGRLTYLGWTEDIEGVQVVDDLGQSATQLEFGARTASVSPADFRPLWRQVPGRYVEGTKRQRT